MPNLPQKAQQQQPQGHKSRHKAPDDIEDPKQHKSFDVATNARTGSTLPPNRVENPEEPDGKAPPPPPVVPMRRHHSKVTPPPPPPTLFLENSLLQRQFANPISYLGGPRLQPRSNRTSIESILSLD